MRYLVAGLGNADIEYNNTRHNAGFFVLDYIVKKEKLEFEPSRHCFLTKFHVKNKLIYMIKPTTFMNNSGKAIRYWVNYLQIPLSNLLIVVDDLALPLGTVRLRSKGGDGGHNGLNNIIYYLGTEDFPRLRIGIGDNFPEGRQVDYVLSEWSEDELILLKTKLPVIYDTIKNFVFEGVDKTMSKYNG